MSTPSRTTETQTFLTPRDVSELLRVFACSVRRWINMGDLPAHKVGRDWRIRREAVAEWLARHQQPGVRAVEVDSSLPPFPRNGKRRYNPAL